MKPLQRGPISTTISARSPEMSSLSVRSSRERRDGGDAGAPVEAAQVLVRVRRTRWLHALGGPDNVSMAAVALAIAGGGALGSLDHSGVPLRNEAGPATSLGTTLRPPLARGLVVLEIQAVGGVQAGLLRFGWGKVESTASPWSYRSAPNLPSACGLIWTQPLANRVWR